mgnify:FL=1
MADAGDDPRQLALFVTAYPEATQTGPEVAARVVARSLAAPREQIHLRVVLDRPAGMPRTRGDCEDGPRPCRWVNCRHHLWAVTDRPGRRRVEGEAPPHVVQRHSAETCALDLAGQVQEYARIAEVLGLTPERARQVTEAAAHKMRAALRDQHDREWGAGLKCEDGCAICDADDHPSNVEEEA